MYSQSSLAEWFYFTEKYKLAGIDVEFHRKKNKTVSYKNFWIKNWLGKKKHISVVNPEKSSRQIGSFYCLFIIINFFSHVWHYGTVYHFVRQKKNKMWFFFSGAVIWARLAILFSNNINIIEYLKFHEYLVPFISLYNI